METQCSWCQKETKALPNTFSQGGESSQYICSDCLLSLLPKSLKMTHQKGFANADKEKRWAQRHPLNSQIYFSWQQKEAHIIQALILNMSDSGIKILIGEAVTPGEAITLAIVGTKLIHKMMGDVIYVKTVGHEQNPCFEVGIKWKDIQQKLRGTIK